MVNLSTIISSGIQIGGGSGSNISVSSPPTGTTNTQRLFAEKRANKTFLRGVGDIGQPVTYQSSMYETTQELWYPLTGSTIGVHGAADLTALNAGTGAAISTPSPTSTSDIEAMKRFLFSTGSTATGTSGVRTASATIYRGNAANRGGWFMFTRLAVPVYETDIRMFIGLSANSTAASGDYSSIANTVGLAKDSADTTWSFIHSATPGPATKFGTGITINSSDIYDFYSYCLPNGSEIYFELRNAITDVLLSSYTATTTLPVSTTFMFPRIGINSISTTTSKQLAINKVYLETEI